MQKVVVIKYNAGNIYSVVHALRRLGVEPVVTADEAVIRASDKVIFPGVGEATTTMRFLKERKMDEAYQDWLRQERDRAYVDIRLLDES